MNYPLKFVLNKALRLVPVFVLKMHNQTNYKCLPRWGQWVIFSSSFVQVLPFPGQGGGEGI